MTIGREKIIERDDQSKKAFFFFFFLFFFFSFFSPTKSFSFFHSTNGVERNNLDMERKNRALACK